jgi:hypothetical protein
MRAAFGTDSHAASRISLRSGHLAIKSQLQLECHTGRVAEGEIVPSPGPWRPPSGARPGWNWIPADHALRPRLDRVPSWVGVWFRTPFIDRFAYVWMWDRGGWDIVPANAPASEDTESRKPLVAKPLPPELNTGSGHNDG